MSCRRSDVLSQIASITTEVPPVTTDFLVILRDLCVSGAGLYIVA